MWSLQNAKSQNYCCYLCNFDSTQTQLYNLIRRRRFCLSNTFSSENHPKCSPSCYKSMACIEISCLSVKKNNTPLFDLFPSFRIESYSCKMAGNDKKLYKVLKLNEGNAPTELQALSPPQSWGQATSVSPTSAFTGYPCAMRQRSLSSGSQEGTLCDTISRKSLFYLISTLNASFQPDYDFSNAKSEEFSRESCHQGVMDSINGNLSATMGDQYMGLKTALWAAIDEEIHLAECDIFR